ncbi:LOW QUALITY PROTEIN: RDH16-like protein [Mya arenaria]|uniref:RDH16-like protein n=1 Tax=Mya arenaria TaxID=6604 RepID=A0ABY7FK31_MYAAR|nr:LOW QUALITY PROTEIN: RDH16-like protein [Mya arenaria]
MPSKRNLIGIGFAIAEHLDELGFTVFAGCLDDKGVGARKLRATCSKKLQVIQCDVTKEDSVSKAAEYVKKSMPKKGLWAVVNNAGMNMISEVELTTPSLGLDVNLYGAIRVMKALLPFILKSQGCLIVLVENKMYTHESRVVNVTSVLGRISRPRWSNYHVSKHGLETLSDSLRLEMAKFGVKVERLKKEAEELWERSPPEVKKSYDRQSVINWIPEARYSDWFTDTEALSSVSGAAHQAICSRHPRTRYMVGGLGRTFRFIDTITMLARFHHFLPTWLADMAIVYMQQGNM